MSSEILQVTVTTADGTKVCSIFVEKTETIENFKALVEVNLGIPLLRQRLFLNLNELSNDKTLEECHVRNNDVIRVEVAAESGGLQETARALQMFYRSQPHIMEQFLASNPAMAQAILSDDTTFLEQILGQLGPNELNRLTSETNRTAAVQHDPLSEEAQMQIEKEIHNRQIQESFEHAMEYSPESFASVYMLYVPCKINGIDIKAFVDSGAQSTILSKSLAEKCSLMRLLDTRFSGIAKGVGTAKILGRIHLVQMKMGSHFFPCSLTVLDQGGVEFLFGLDMLKRHQACIDLKENVLKIGDEKIHFLSEKDLPDYAKERSPQHEEKSQVQPQVSANPPSSRPISATSSANPSSARQPAPAQQTSNSQFNESQIKVLTDLGFSRQDSLDALRLFNGNTEMAASYLFSKSSGLDF